MTAKEFREKENWNKSDFFKGEYDIDLNSIDEYAEDYYQAKLKLLGIANVVGQSEQLKCSRCKKPLNDGLCSGCCSDLASGNY